MTVTTKFNVGDRVHFTDAPERVGVITSADVHFSSNGDRDIRYHVKEANWHDMHLECRLVAHE